MSIRNKIFIVILLTALLPLGLVALAIFPFDRANLIERDRALLSASNLNRATRAAAVLRGEGAETLQQIADQVPVLGETTEVLIFARQDDGRFVPVIEPRFIPSGSTAFDPMQPLLAEAASDAEPHVAVAPDQRGVKSLMIARRVEGRHVVVTKKDLAEILRPDDVLRDYFLVLSFIAIALAALLGILLARSATAPLLTLTRTVASFGSEKPERIEVVGNDEVAALARAFRTIWEKLRAYNEDLGEAVWKRTAELGEAERELERSNAALKAKLEEIEKLYAMLLAQKNDKGPKAS